MIQHEIFLEEPTNVQKAAEAMASQIRHNLCEFTKGNRESFSAYFPLNLDTYGEGNGVNDIAHDIFYKTLPVDSVEDDYLILNNGTKLYYTYLVSEDEGIPFSAHYSSEQITMPDNSYNRQARLDEVSDHECRVREELRKLRELGRTAVSSVSNSAADMLNIDRKTFGWGNSVDPLTLSD